MDSRSAQILLKSLIDRVVPTENARHRLEGLISPSEIDALRFALDLVGADDASSTSKYAQAESSANAPRGREPWPLVLDPNRLQPPDGAATLCLDFGTAKSKAYATRTNEDGAAEDVPLLLGPAGGEQGYPLTSAVWIDESGRISFGQEAVEKSIQRRDPSRRRIESLKQELSQGSREALPAKLDPAENPTAVPLTKRDVLAAYLAFFTEAAETALKGQGLSPHVRRRFAVPAWEDSQIAEVIPVMRDLLALGQVIADSVHGRWAEFTVHDLRSLCDEADALHEKWPVSLVAGHVLEPVAAGKSRLEREETWKGLALVVDIGAGTSDFALFYASENPDDDKFEFWPFEHARGAVKRAGDTLDSCLVEHILQRERITDVDPGARQRIAAALRVTIRGLKESLFGDGKVTYTLADSQVGTVMLDEFLADEGVGRFKKQLFDYADEILGKLSEQEIRKFSVTGIRVVLTGGGAKIPFLRDIGSRETRPRGISIRWRLAELIPEDVKGRPIEPDYLQLAVAQGGAQPNLAITRRSISRVGTMVTQNVQLTTVYKQ